MTFLTWLSLNYNKLHKLAIKIDYDNGEEVLHFTLEKFLSKTDTEYLDIMKDGDKLKYMSRTLKIQATSVTSQFYREFKKYTVLAKDVTLELEEKEYEEDSLEEKQLKFIEEQFKEMNWFSALLYRRYIDTGYSAKVLADEFKIPLSTVQYHLRKVRTEIRNNWDKLNNNG